MNADLLRQLRDPNRYASRDPVVSAAADEIERLGKEISELTRALADVATTNTIQIADMQRKLECAPSETAPTDPGTEKLLRDLLDRGYKMHLMAGSMHVVEQDPNSNDPLIAWLSDVRAILYGNTKPTPDFARLK